MTDYSKLVKDLRDTERVCRDRMDGQVMLDAADAIEALQAEVNRLELDNEDYEHEHRRLKGEIDALQAEIPIVETVLVDKLRQRIDELEEKQTYCDAYGDKWMTSGKDVPTEAYKHGYADGRDEAQKQIDSIENDKTILEADIINLEIALDKVNTQLPKRGEIVRCGECKYHMAETERTNPYCAKYHCMRTDDWFCADGERKE